MGKIVEFITKGALFGGVRNYVWLIALALIGIAVFTIITIADHRDKRLVDTATRQGVTAAVVAGQKQTLDQLGDAKHAQQDLHAGGERSAVRYEQCLLDSERPSACERYNPRSR